MRAPRTKSETENNPMFPPLPILKAPLPPPPVLLVVVLVPAGVPVVEFVVVVELAPKDKVPNDLRLGGATSCFSGKPEVLLTAEPTCQTWFTDAASFGTLTVAKIVKVSLENSALTSQTSNESFPGTMELYEEMFNVLTAGAPFSVL